MKKNWFYLFALICSVALFTACSDDEPANLSVDTVNGTYPSTDGTNVLQLTYGDAAMSGKSVTFNSADGQTATITLSGAENALLSGLLSQSIKNPGVVPGEASTTLNVTLVPEGTTGYTFAGTDESNGRTLVYTGAIEAGKLTLDVDVTFTNDLIGTWNLVPVPSSSSETLYPIHSVWQSSKQISIELFPGYAMEMPMETILSLALRMPVVGDQSVCQMLTTVLQSVTFGADGNVIASYSDAADVASPTWQNSPAGMVQYCVANGKLLAYLDIDTILGAVMGASTKADANELLTKILPILLGHINEIAPMLSQGIPLSYAADEATGVLTVYIDQNGLGGVLLDILGEVMNDPELMAMIAELAASGMGSSGSSLAGMLPAILEQLPAVVEGTTTLELGLNFNTAE